MASFSRLLRLISARKSLSGVRISSVGSQSCSFSESGQCIGSRESKYAFGSANYRGQSTERTWRHALPLAMAVSAGVFALGSEPKTSMCEANQTLRMGGSGNTEIAVEGSQRKLPEGFLDELKAVCGDRIILDYEERDFYGKPQNSFHKAVNIPDVVVCPMSTKEVSEIVKACDKYKIPIIPYGGATSVEGHTMAPHGGLCIDMRLMKDIKALHLEDMDVVVDPGIGWMELNEYLKPYGLFFPLDPGPGATIGGMCATRCSGSLAVRYGTMRDNVINLQVVLANGDVVKTASRARKSAAGYDLTRLIIGSEGTLGVITEVTLRLQKIPESSVVALCNFPSVKDAANVAIATLHSNFQVSRVELLDEVQIKALNMANEKNLREAPTLLFELIGTEAYAREQALRVQEIVREHHGFDFIFMEDSKEKAELWKAVLAVDNRENVGMAILSYLEMATQADRDVLQRCGLYKALRTPQYTSDQRLIVDIVSHWDRRRHVFHLPQVGDVMVTPRDIRRILGVPATGMPVRLGTLPSTEAAHREAAQFFTGAGRWDRRGAPLQTVLLSGIPRVRKMIILCILFRISRRQNYREVPGGWMDAVRRCEAGERMDWAALIAANLVAQLDTIRASGRGGLSYSTLLQCWFFDHFAAVAPAGGPHPITEGAPMVHRWQTRLRGTEDRAHVRRSVEATSLDLLTLPDYTAEPYRTVRWDSDDEAGGAGAPAGDDSSDDGDSGDSGADPSRPAETAGPSGTAGQAEDPSGAAEGEAGPSGARGDVRGPMTRARRLRIVMGPAGARAGAIPTRRGTQAAEEVPEDEAPAAGGEPGGEDAGQPEDQAATAGTAEIRRLVEAVVRELFPQVYAEGQPPIQAGDEPRAAGAHREAFAPLVRARDVWAAESQEHATSLGQLQQERDDARRERDELRRQALAQEAQGGAGGDSESRTQLLIITERLRVTEEALRGERDRIQARYDQLVAQMVSRSSRSGTHTHTAATTPRRPRDEGSEAGSSRRTRRSLGGVWSPGEGSQRPGESAPGAGPQQ